MMAFSYVNVFISLSSTIADRKVNQPRTLSITDVNTVDHTDGTTGRAAAEAQVCYGGACFRGR